jgi:type I restriction enzyme S subunit
MEVKAGYKKTEVGVIPKEWEVKRLGDVADMGSGGTPPSSVPAYYDGDIPWASISDMTKGGKVILITDRNLTRAGFTNSAAQMFPAGTILYAMYASLGECSIAGIPLCSSQAILGIRPNQRLSGEYLYYFLTSFKGVVKTLGQQGTQANLNKGMVQDFRLSLPPLPEQTAIATALSDVDGLLDGLDRLIAKKRDLKQAAMQRLLTGQTRLPGFHAEWEVKTLGDIVEKIVGGGTPSRVNTAFWGNEIPWVTVKDFATFNPRHSQESVTRLGLCNSASHLIPAGTLITSTRMALGKAVVYEVDVAINQDLKALFLKPEISVVYLTYWFEYFGNLIDELGSGSTVKGISLVELRRFPFQTPPHPEQTAIAEVLTEMDAELAALEQRREKTRALKQAMMQELLTGRIRLVGKN